jgi:hypothetical protein
MLQLDRYNPHTFAKHGTNDLADTLQRIEYDN